MDSIPVLIGLICILCSSYGSLAARRGKGIEVYCEGREAVLSFLFPSKIINVELRRGNRAPFYDSGQLLETGLTQDQVHRFQVRSHMNYTHYELIVTIANVSKRDGGTYTGLAYTNRDKEATVTKNVALVIEYPPGDPQCRIIFRPNIDVIHETWDIIECTADKGTMPGYIACFQNNVALPVHGNMVLNSSTLLQRLWVKRGLMFSCCSTDYRSSVSAKSCTAYQMGNGNILTTPHARTENYETSSMSTPSKESISKNGSTGMPLSFTEIVVLTVIPLLIIVVSVVSIILIKSRFDRRSDNVLSRAAQHTEVLLDKTIQNNNSSSEIIQRHGTLCGQNLLVFNVALSKKDREMLLNISAVKNDSKGETSYTLGLAGEGGCREMGSQSRGNSTDVREPVGACIAEEVTELSESASTLCLNSDCDE